jgi:hypothetical protein
MLFIKFLLNVAESLNYKIQVLWISPSIVNKQIVILQIIWISRRHNFHIKVNEGNFHREEGRCSILDRWKENKKFSCSLPD